jgi:hypothetical protein
MSRTSRWVRTCDASTENAVEAGSASTNDPRPWKVSTSPAACSRETASRTTVRLTPNSWISDDSVGSFCPGWISPARMRALSRSTSSCASPRPVSRSSR